MKKIITSIALLAITSVFSQAYDGFGDTKTSVSGNFQKGGFGLNVTWDYGYTDYISFGSSFGYIVSVSNNQTPNPAYDPIFQPNEPKTIEILPEDALVERLDFNFRMNGHLGSVIGMNEMSDVYAGANISFRNIGTQAGFRYLFSDSFGVFAEASVPVFPFGLTTGLNDINYYSFYEKPSFSIGIVFSK